MNADKPIILVTGCSGLIGSRLCQHLSDDYQILGLDIERPKGTWDHFTFYNCDLTKDMSVRSVFETIQKNHGNQVASVVHLAAFYDFSGKPHKLYGQLTIEGTRRLLQSLRDYQLEQFIFSSSLLVMNPVDARGERLDESSPVHAEWEYPKSKLEAERLLSEAETAFDVVVLRIAGVYTNRCDSLPLSHHIRRIYERRFESYFFPGDPDHGQPFVHIDDLIASIRNAIERRKILRDSEIFLIAEPQTLSHRDLQGKIGELVHGRKWPTIPIPKTVAKAGAWITDKLSAEKRFIQPWMIDLADDHYATNIQAARDRLDWNPVHRLEESLPHMIHSLKQDPQEWYRSHGLQG